MLTRVREAWRRRHARRAQEALAAEESQARAGDPLTNAYPSGQAAARRLGLRV